MDKGLIFIWFSTVWACLAFGLCVGYYYGMSFAAM